MANRSSGESRHQQSIAPMLVDVAQHGWRSQLIEHEGIRQYRLTKQTAVPGEGVLERGPDLIASAYFEWVVTAAAFLEHPTHPLKRPIPVPEQDEGKWRYVIGFVHGEPEVPLRLMNLRAFLRGECTVCAGTGVVGQARKFCSCERGQLEREAQLDLAADASLNQGEH